jgi:CDP-6-deoxy-D-xylo-4-hexulose-3-dehydrase
MKGRDYRVHGTLKNSDRVVDNTFWIGVFPGIGEPEVEYVLDVIHRFSREATARGRQGRA